MRPLAWAQVAAFALISAVLASPSLAQTAVDPGPSSGSTTPEAFRVAVDPPPAPPTPDFLMNVIWLEQPNARDFALNYPTRAQAETLSGRVTLDCRVIADGRLNCLVTNEDPHGYGFAEATLAISREFRLAPQTRDGVPTEGGRIRRTIRWVIS